MDRPAAENPYVTSRPLEVAFRYVGPIFDSTAASATMASEIISATSFFCESVGRYVAPDPGYVHPRIARVANGSWEIILQFAVQTFEEVKSFGNMPHVSALANIGGSAAMILGAVKICAKFRKEKPIQKNRDGSLTLVADGEKFEVPQAALELALDPKFRLGLEAILAFQLLRPGVENVDVRVGNEYVSVNKDDAQRIVVKPEEIVDYRSGQRNESDKKQKPLVIRFTEEKVLRFENPSQRGNFLIFTDCYREPKSYSLGMIASRQIKTEFGGKLYRGRFYSCIVENGIQQYSTGNRYLTIDAMQFIGPDIPKNQSEIYVPDESRLRMPKSPNQALQVNTSRLTAEEVDRRKEALHRALSSDFNKSRDS